jgi:hypothetical protein
MHADMHVQGDLIGPSSWPLCASRTPCDAAKTCAVQQYLPLSTDSIVGFEKTGNSLRFWPMWGVDHETLTRPSRQMQLLCHNHTASVLLHHNPVTLFPDLFHPLDASLNRCSMRHLLVQGSFPTDSCLSYRVVGNAEEIPKIRTMSPTPSVLVRILGRVSPLLARVIGRKTWNDVLLSASMTSHVEVRYVPISCVVRNDAGTWGFTPHVESKAYYWPQHVLKGLV